jgi:hypothetical protein
MDFIFSIDNKETGALTKYVNKLGGKTCLCGVSIPTLARAPSYDFILLQDITEEDFLSVKLRFMIKSTTDKAVQSWIVDE